MRLITLSLVAALGGCSLMPDHSLDYQRATQLPPLRLPEGQPARPLKPLYEIPDAATASAAQAIVVEGKGRKQHFAAPLPKPLVVASSTGTETPNQPAPGPQVITDGNGHPVLQVGGDLLLVWDRLGKALAAAGIKVSDRNQSLGLYFVDLPRDGGTAAYQLKLTRASNDNVIALQKDDDTLAETGLSRTTLDSLAKHWPN